MKKSIFASVIFTLMDVILAVAIILTAFPVTEITAFAAEDLFSFNDELAAIEFDSYEKFREYVTTPGKDFKSDGMEPEVAEYLQSIDGIFIPSEVSANDINSVLITPSYIELTYSYNGVKIRFSFYYDEAGGKMTYENSKSGRGNGAEQSGNIIYYTAPYFGDYETYYVWHQDGNYFQLRISGNHGDRYLSMCNAVMNGFDDAARSGDLQIKGGAVSGTAIRTADRLMNMKADGNYYLANDIDLSNVKWRAISGFYGTFNGNNYEITGLTSETDGLFSSLKTGAEIKNVKLTNVYITSKYKSVGAIASVIQSGAENISIDNCFVSGLVSSCRTKYGQNANSGSVGSIVGVNCSVGTVISNCYSNAVVASERTVGGIVGTNKGTIKNCGFGGQIGSAYNVYELGCDKNGNKNGDYKYLYSVGGIAGFILTSDKIFNNKDCMLRKSMI